MRIIVAISGASGSAYAIRLIEEIAEEHEILLVASETAKQIMQDEANTQYRDLEAMVTESYDNYDMGANICSGSHKYDAMVIVPCSMTTLAKLATGIGDNVITRAGAVTIKERRKLIIVPRETPLSTIHLKNMYELSLAGAIIVPAMPGFYNRPTSILDLQRFMTGRILDLLGLPNDISPRWNEIQDQI